MIADMLSKRELQILHLLAYEYQTHEIAAELFISPHTVITHRRNLLTKLEVRNTAGMVRAAFEYGLLTTSASPDKHWVNNKALCQPC
jgi:DNA-binding CsgD family transcriptional regulator